MKFTFASLNDLSRICPCCQDIAATFPTFNTTYSPVNVFRLVIDETDIMLKYKVPRNMRGDSDIDYPFLLPTEPISDTIEQAVFYNSKQLNVDLARRWIGKCEHTHGEACYPAEQVPLPGLASILLVDVIDWCVVSQSPNARYVALSYCWGQTVANRSLKENIPMLAIPGALSPNITVFKIPPIIADAITNLYARSWGEVLMGRLPVYYPGRLSSLLVQ